MIKRGFLFEAMSTRLDCHVNLLLKISEHPDSWIQTRGIYNLSYRNTFLILYENMLWVLQAPQHIYCGYSLEVPQWGTSNEYPQYIFSWKNKKNIYMFGLKNKSTLFGAMLDLTILYFKLWTDPLDYLLMWVKTAGWLETLHTLIQPDVGLQYLLGYVCRNI